MSSQNAERDRIALIELFLGAGAIAFAPIFVRVSEFDPTAPGFYRFDFAVPFLWLWLCIERRATSATTMRPSGLRDQAPLLLGGLLFAGDIGFWYWSSAHTSVANATLLASAAPVFVVLAGWLLFGSLVRPLFLFGLVQAMGGTTLLMRTSVTAGQEHLLGDLLGASPVRSMPPT